MRSTLLAYCIDSNWLDCDGTGCLQYAVRLGLRARSSLCKLYDGWSICGPIRTGPMRSQEVVLKFALHTQIACAPC